MSFAPICRPGRAAPLDVVWPGGSDRIGAWHGESRHSPVRPPTRRRRQPVKEASNMSDSIVRDHPAVKVIVGVDTHKHEHVAVAIDSLGARLAMFRVPANGAPATLPWWLGLAPSATSNPSGSKAPVPTGPASPGLCAERGFASSKSTSATGASGATTARTTCSTPRPPRGPCSPASRPPSRKPPTGWRKWSARSRSHAIRPSRPVPPRW